MSWQRVQGHDVLVDAFRLTVRRGRLGHAYLFTGPSGVGKHLFAEELARAILCEGRAADDLEACDTCTSCALAEAGTHPDLFHAGLPEEKHEIPIDVMRELCRGIALRTARGRGKVAILDDADHLNEESSNCFLKTLEEPPPGSVFLMVGNSPDRQLPTILSRCQVIRFAPLPMPLLTRFLQEKGVEPGDAERLARLGGGSVGQALAMRDPALWEFRKTILEAIHGRPFASVALARDWMTFVEEAGKDGASQRHRASLTMRVLIEFLADTLRVAQGIEPEQPDDLPVLAPLAERLGSEGILKLLERCIEADRQVERRVQLVLVLEALADALGRLIR